MKSIFDISADVSELYAAAMKIVQNGESDGRLGEIVDNFDIEATIMHIENQAKKRVSVSCEPVSGGSQIFLNARPVGEPVSPAERTAILNFLRSAPHVIKGIGPTTQIDIPEGP